MHLKQCKIVGIGNCCGAIYVDLRCSWALICCPRKLMYSWWTGWFSQPSARLFQVAGQIENFVIVVKWQRIWRLVIEWHGPELNHFSWCLSPISCVSVKFLFLRWVVDQISKCLETGNQVQLVIDYGAIGSGVLQWNSLTQMACTVPWIQQ